MNSINFVSSGNTGLSFAPVVSGLLKNYPLDVFNTFFSVWSHGTSTLGHKMRDRIMI